MWERMLWNEAHPWEEGSVVGAGRDGTDKTSRDLRGRDMRTDDQQTGSRGAASRARVKRTRRAANGRIGRNGDTVRLRRTQE